MKKNKIVLTSLIASLLMLSIFPLVHSSYNSTEAEEYDYTINESNGVMEIWGVGSCAIEIGGTITFVENGEYLSYGVEEMHYNVTFNYANGTINQTIANYSSTSVAYAFILGFGYWQPGIQIDTNWTTQDNTATMLANTPASELYSPNGTLSITSENGIRSYDYTQNGSLGNQKTFLQYDEDSGELIRWNCTFLGYSLDASLTDSSFNIPGYSSLFIGFSSILVGIGILKKKKK
jgi:hypothetical protein